MPALSQITSRIGNSISNMFAPRETAADRAGWLDQITRQAVNGAMQNTLQTARTTSKRSFETAETPAYTDSWATTAGELNDDLARQLPTMRGRSRNIARNNEWGSSYLLQLHDNVLGHQGIRLQMRVKLPNGKPDRATNALIEAAFAKWCKRGNCDVSRSMSWAEIEGTALSSLPRDGELVWRPRPGMGPMGWQMQLLPAPVLDVTVNRTWGGNRVRMGVEFNADGERTAYWLKATKAGDGTSDGITSVGRHVRVEASLLHHHYVAEEIDQLRGIPWLSVGARRLWLLHDFEDSAAVASSNAAKRQGFFTSADGSAPPGFSDHVVSQVLDAAKAAGKVLSPDEIKALTDAAQKYTSVVPGQFDTLPTGYDFKAFESAWPNINADTYVKQQIRGWSAARGSSYVSIGNDLEAVNYSSAQVGIVQEREHFKTIQERLISWLHQPTIEALLPYLILSEPRLRMSRLADYIAGVTWQPRRWSPIDPVKDATAKQIRLSLKLASRRRIIAEGGDDPDEILAEAEEEELLYGPVVPRAGTPSQSSDNTDKKTKDTED